MTRDLGLSRGRVGPFDRASHRIAKRFRGLRECGPKGGVGSKNGTGRERVSIWDQVVARRSKDRAGRRGGARAGKPRWVRIGAITMGSRRAAMILKAPPQFGQCARSISKTRLSSRAQLMRAGPEVGCVAATRCGVSRLGRRAHCCGLALVTYKILTRVKSPDFNSSSGTAM
jgi:hypothetical protein